jgi:hypothetical protein
VRIASIFACCVLLASVICAEDVTVQTKPLESSSRVQVTVILGGKPSKGVKVDFYSEGRQFFLSALTDEHGIVAPPELVPGNYIVVAALDEDVSASLVLHVVGGRKLSKFSVDLTERFAQSRDELQTLEKLPVRDHVQDFQGVVVDPSPFGTFIPDAKIRILRKGSAEKTVGFRLNADENGHFSAQLADGLYIGFFYSPGFRTAVVPFEVTKDGSGNLRIVMQIGHT